MELEKYRRHAVYSVSMIIASCGEIIVWCLSNMLIQNPYRGQGLPSVNGLADGDVSTDATAAQSLFGLCPAAHQTPMLVNDDLAGALGVSRVFIKDERGRMGLGSFKSLGAAYAIAKAAAKRVNDGAASSYESALTGETYICASAGNHGLSMAAGARLFGADAVVYLSETVPENFAGRLADKGATVVREGHNYEASMAAAQKAASDNDWNLLSDSSWAGYSDPARDVMEGYLIMAAEAAAQVPEKPTHVFLQAGVGGLAAACTAGARLAWGDDVTVCIVEPEAAPALLASIKAGTAVTAPGPVSCMGRLDCKDPSHLALKYLAREADAFMTVTEEEALDIVAMLNNFEISSSPSGTAGIAGLRQVTGSNENPLDLNGHARVLVYVSEGAADD